LVLGVVCCKYHFDSTKNKNYYLDKKPTYYKIFILKNIEFKTDIISLSHNIEIYVLEGVVSYLRSLLSYDSLKWSMYFFMENKYLLPALLL